MIIFKKDFGNLRYSVHYSRPEGLDLYQVKQVHGNNIVEVPTERIAADGMICLSFENASRLSILTADCLPVFIYGDNGYALVHAGWRGIAAGIFTNEVLKKIRPKYIFIGPHIHSCCYQVQDDFMNNFKGSSSFSQRNGKIYFDLSGEAKKQLEEKHPSARIEICKECTCCSDHFHSYRRNKTEKRNWNIIEIKE